MVFNVMMCNDIAKDDMVLTLEILIELVLNKNEN